MLELIGFLSVLLLLIVGIGGVICAAFVIIASMPDKQRHKRKHKKQGGEYE